KRHTSTQYPGWNIRFAFTKDDRLKVHNQFVLYQVNVTADYPATKTTIKNAPGTFGVSLR
ncbi:hypothetical protein NECAME_19362, partial [Necator americanus]